MIHKTDHHPVLSNNGKTSCSSKVQEPLVGLELTTDRHPLIASQTCYPLLPAAPHRPHIYRQNECHVKYYLLVLTQYNFDHNLSLTIHSETLAKENKTSISLVTT